MEMVPALKSSICDVPGISVGHYHDQKAQTGCTVILVVPAAIAGVDVRGSAPGTHEIELLKPVRLVNHVNAILLTGGSSFGLAAATGVKRYLVEQGIGYDTGIAQIPIVPAAVIFDLGVGDPGVYPDADMGYAACQNARKMAWPEGLIGAGSGATVGKLAGQQNAMAGGVGSCARKIGPVVVGVLSVVNSLGNVITPGTGTILAGARDPATRGFLDPIDQLINMEVKPFPGAINTTLAVVAANVEMTREDATKIAQMAQDGLARAIHPAHTMYDGDIVFVLATGQHRMNINAVGAIAAELVAESIVRAVRTGNNLVE